MAKNNKGFMLIEVIVTSTIVVTTMIVLYTSFNKIYNNYRTKNSYYNLDTVYATKEMINAMLKNDTGNINTFINTTMPYETYGYIISNSNCVNEFVDNEFVVENLTPSICQNLQKLYSIDNMILSEYDPESLNDLKEINLNQTFKEYIDYVKKYYDIENTIEEYNYIILTEVKDGNNYYYANLRMR